MCLLSCQEAPSGRYRTHWLVFNPNIHPYTEWDHRLKTAAEFAEKVDMPFEAEKHYQLRDFLKRALPAEATANGRCTMCYTWRLEGNGKICGGAWL